MKKVLIITYYWPPAGGSGVQRWLKFVKYLGEYGYEPVVYTPLNPEFMAIDPGLLEEIPEGVEVVKRKIFEPYSLYKLFTGKKGQAIKPGFIAESKSGKTNKSPLSERVSLLIRSNFFIPDPKCFWISPSVRFLKKYLRENPVNVIVSSGPPHSMHLIAKKVARETGIPWLADFRDPWTRMYNFKYMNNTKFVERIHKRMEKSVVRQADVVVVVTNVMCEEYRELGAKRIEVITNGFDYSDFAQTPESLEELFTITYTGLFVKDRNPGELWRLLGERVKSDNTFAKDLRIRIIGQADQSIWDDISTNGLNSNLVKMDYMPHSQVVKWQQKARVLLLTGGQEPEAKGILTGKFFEYLATRRPIIGFGPLGGDMDVALKESEAGEMFDYGDYAGAKKWIDTQYDLYKKGIVPKTSGKIDRYSRKELCHRMAELLDEIIEKKCKSKCKSKYE
ncbi:MAG: glycosyltransferase [Bacteroidales bacterium]